MIEEDTVNKQDLRKFGFILGALFVFIFGMLIPFLVKKNIPTWPFIVAAALWAPAVLFPTLLKGVYRIWMAIGNVLGWINTRIILGLIFFVVLTPIALLKRIFGEDAMKRSFEDCESYKIQSDVRTIQHMEKPF